MTDSELLELAAKAVGIEFTAKRAVGSSTALYVGPQAGGWWDPLKDDGDAFRLAVKLRIDIPWRPITAGTSEDEERALIRRAVVRAAAAMAPQAQTPEASQELPAGEGPKS